MPTLRVCKFTARWLFDVFDCASAPKSVQGRGPTLLRSSCWNPSFSAGEVGMSVQFPSSGPAICGSATAELISLPSLRHSAKLQSVGATATPLLTPLLMPPFIVATNGWCPCELEPEPSRSEEHGPSVMHVIAVLRGGGGVVPVAGSLALGPFLVEKRENKKQIQRTPFHSILLNQIHNFSTKNFKVPIVYRNTYRRTRRTSSRPLIGPVEIKPSNGDINFLDSRRVLHPANGLTSSWGAGAKKITG